VQESPHGILFTGSTAGLITKQSVVRSAVESVAASGLRSLAGGLILSVKTASTSQQGILRAEVFD